MRRRGRIGRSAPMARSAPVLTSAMTRWVLFLSVAVLCGCGYRFTAGRGGLPGGIRSVCVPVMVNRTSEAGLEAFYTEDLRQALLHAGVLGGRDCQARIEGELRDVTGGPTIISNSGDLASYRISVTVHLKLVQNGKVLSETDARGTEDYLPAREQVGDVLQTELNRTQALRRIGPPMMRDGYERLATAW